MSLSNLNLTAEAANARNYDLVNLTRNRNYFDRANAEVNQREFLQDLQERSYGNSIVPPLASQVIRAWIETMGLPVPSSTKSLVPNPQSVVHST